MLPFTAEQFLNVFAAYNAAIWPIQVAFYLLGLATVALLFWTTPNSSKIVAMILASMWLWTGLAYHLRFFASINTAAYLFAAIFVAEAVYLGASGLRGRLIFAWRPELAGWIGSAFIAYAMGVYPLVGIWAGHTYPQVPMFGVTPCPVTIFTIGTLLLTTTPPPLGLLVIPLIWSLVGGSATVLLHVPQDWPLLASAAIVAPAIIFRGRTKAKA